MSWHCAHVSRHQYTTGLCGDAKNVWINSAIWDDASGGTKIDGWLAAAQASADGRI